MGKGALHRYKLTKGKSLFAVEFLPKPTNVVGIAATFVVREVGVEVAAFDKEGEGGVDGLGGAGGKGGIASADAAAAVDIGTGGVEEGRVWIG